MPRPALEAQRLALAAPSHSLSLGYDDDDDDDGFFFLSPSLATAMSFPARKERTDPKEARSIRLFLFSSLFSQQQQ